MTAPARRPATPSPPPAPGVLELYQFEGCPFCARVRETLDDLGLDYVVRTVPHDLGDRARVIAISGQPRVPVLVDPARKVVLPESDDIIAYLHEQYGAKNARAPRPSGR